MDIPVAYICEHDNEKTILSRTFILFDPQIQKYHLYGLVGYEVDGEQPQFSYVADSIGAIFDYLDFMNDVNSLYTYELLNYNAKYIRPETQITFEWLHANKQHWLAAYDGQPFLKKRIGQLLRIVKSMTS